MTFALPVLYEDSLKNTIYVTIHHVGVTLAVLVNITLMFCIITCRKQDFGAYRYLLLTFASVDLIYALTHFIVMPVPEAWANAFYMGAHGYVRGHFSVSWFAGTHSLSFPVLVFHFLYRYLAVKGSLYLNLFRKPWFYLAQFSFVFSIGATWFLTFFFLNDCDDFVAEYMKPILRNHTRSISLPLEEYTIALYWKNDTFSGPRWKPILGFMIMGSTMGGCYAFMIFAAVTIVGKMQHKSTSKSENTTRLQQQLLIALAYQSILPLITAYSPPFLCIIGPFIGMSTTLIADVSPLLCMIHPVFDGLVLIWTIRAYREIILNCFRRKAFRQNVSSTPANLLQSDKSR